ncbi:hypothetical protein EAG_14161 [Camponotus floridanus]|uniref:Uncharacterized protein n=1 Tax=Camponotus floridanus TaxID=104421 RepID=E2A5W0_CAMFO|nr:hypothetical protein EAG_14161 [Camponotus floridanus]
MSYKREDAATYNDVNYKLVQTDQAFLLSIHLCVSARLRTADLIRWDASSFPRTCAQNIIGSGATSALSGFPKAVLEAATTPFEPTRRTENKLTVRDGRWGRTGPLGYHRVTMAAMVRPWSVYRWLSVVDFADGCFGVGCGGNGGGDGSGGWWCDSGGEEVVVEYGAKETTHRTDKKRQVCTALRLGAANARPAFPINRGSSPSWGGFACAPRNAGSGAAGMND